MSPTFTFPLSASDQFNHGHTHTHSHSHSHSQSGSRYPRSGARLAPPFSLPRIPSESLTATSKAFANADRHATHDGKDNAHGVKDLAQISPDEDLVVQKRSSASATMAYTPGIAHRHRAVSKPTEILLSTTENYSLLHGIIADDDSRRIFYFMFLNLAFMMVQSTYGYLTGSLGLISDSIHMFFDCVALLVGVCAAVMSKWPPSLKFPYGYGKIDTLAGLGNGIFLMLISVEIVYEAIERLFTGADISRTTELLIVSSMGLAVNMVGIFAFHGHHGHGHDHGHSDSHSHSHGHEHHSHKKSDGDIIPAVTDSPKKNSGTNGHSHGHGHHHHGSENMEGIYLHIMADALGSVAVVGSTLLVKFTGWSGWDPIASCIIAVLIFISTIPLIRSTTKILLLSLNSDIEYNLRDILSGVSGIRGVVGYTVPRFWLEDIKKDPGHDHHHHGHSHTHGHDHDHNHDHMHSHNHSSCDSKDGDHLDQSEKDPAVLGVIHIIASPTADLADVRSRVRQYFASKRMNVLVQVERDGDSRCFCSGGLRSG